MRRVSDEFSVPWNLIRAVELRAVLSSTYTHTQHEANIKVDATKPDTNPSINIILPNGKPSPASKLHQKPKGELLSGQLTDVHFTELPLRPSRRPRVPPPPPPPQSSSSSTVVPALGIRHISRTISEFASSPGIHRVSTIFVTFGTTQKY